MVPNVSAVEYKEVKDATREYTDIYISVFNILKNQNNLKLSIVSSFINVLIYIFIFFEFSIWIIFALEIYLNGFLQYSLTFIESLVLAFIMLLYTNGMALFILLLKLFY